jgi:hypothetical protein
MPDWPRLDGLEFAPCGVKRTNRALVVDSQENQVTGEKKNSRSEGDQYNRVKE